MSGYNPTSPLDQWCGLGCCKGKRTKRECQAAKRESRDSSAVEPPSPLDMDCGCGCGVTRRLCRDTGLRLAEAAEAAARPMSPLDQQCEKCGDPCGYDRRQYNEIGCPYMQGATEPPQAPEAQGVTEVAEKIERPTTGLLGPLLDTLPQLGEMELDLVRYYVEQLICRARADL